MTSFELNYPNLDPRLYAEPDGDELDIQAEASLTVEEAEQLARYLNAWVELQKASKPAKPELEFKIDHDYTNPCESIDGRWLREKMDEINTTFTTPNRFATYDTSDCPCRKENGGSGICNCVLNNYIIS